MAAMRDLRWNLLSLALDLICLVIFAVTAVFAVFSKRTRRDALHAFTRNFWGARGPKLDGRPVVWMHAVSVGEMRICRTVLSQLSEQRPDLQFVVSIGTSDAMSVAHNELPSISLFYIPFDFSWAVRRTFDLLNPVALIIAENDFWAQFLNEAKRRAVPLAIFNTRMSPREQTEHRWNAWLLKPGLKRAAWWGAVSKSDAEWISHFFEVTSPPLEVTGSLKFDGQIRDPRNPGTQELRRTLGYLPTHQILVAGSTHDTEEKLIAAVACRLAKEFPNLRVVIAPRSAIRATDVVEAIRQDDSKVVLNSQAEATRPADAPLITVIDSIGILPVLWGLADIAFVGGSLVRHGGQNMVEPASYGKPVCFGPHVWNFQPIVAQLLAENAARQVQSESELESMIRNWLSNPEEARQVGVRAQAVAISQTEPLRRTVDGILSILPAPEPRQVSHSSIMDAGNRSCATAEAS